MSRALPFDHLPDGAPAAVATAFATLIDVQRRSHEARRDLEQAQRELGEAEQAARRAVQEAARTGQNKRPRVDLAAMRAALPDRELELEALVAAVEQANRELRAAIVDTGREWSATVAASEGASCERLRAVVDDLEPALAEVGEKRGLIAWLGRVVERGEVIGSPPKGTMPFLSCEAGRYFANGDAPSTALLVSWLRDLVQPPELVRPVLHGQTPPVPEQTMTVLQGRVLRAKPAPPTGVPGFHG